MKRTLYLLKFFSICFSLLVLAACSGQPAENTTATPEAAENGVAQAVPPFRPLAIDSATIHEIEGGANLDALLAWLSPVAGPANRSIRRRRMDHWTLAPPCTSTIAATLLA